MRESVGLVGIACLCVVAIVVSVPTVAGEIWAGLSAMLGL